MVMETHRKFDEDFKQGGVRTVRETGKPIAQVARGFGVNEGGCAVRWSSCVCSVTSRRNGTGTVALLRAGVKATHATWTQLRPALTVTRPSVRSACLRRSGKPPSNEPKTRSLELDTAAFSDDSDAPYQEQRPKHPLSQRY
jgi:hypothetical protein